MAIIKGIYIYIYNNSYQLKIYAYKHGLTLPFIYRFAGWLCQKLCFPKELFYTGGNFIDVL